MAHPTIRNRGTAVGSIVHADPAAELPAVLLLCDGHVTLADETEVAATDLFVGPLETASGPALSSLGHAAYIPPPRPAPPGSRCPAGPATSPCAVSASRSPWTTATARPGPGGVRLGRPDPDAGRPDRRGRRQPVDTADWTGAGSLAAGQVEPDEDIHASARTAGTGRALTARAGMAAGVAA